MNDKPPPSWIIGPQKTDILQSPEIDDQYQEIRKWADSDTLSCLALLDYCISNPETQDKDDGNQANISNMDSGGKANKKNVSCLLIVPRSFLQSWIISFIQIFNKDY